MITVLITEDQEECKQILDTLEITHLVVPVPPARSTSALLPVGPAYVIAENSDGVYRLHLVQGATQEEAFKLFDATFQGSKKINPRMNFVGASSESASVN
jgi:hypothetical protein